MNANQIELAKKNGTVEVLYSRLVEDKIARKYTLGQQIAILRQREEKPEEFAAFFAFAEQCKKEARAYIDGNGR